MEAIYWEPPTAEELSGGKYKVSDFPEPHVDLWDEHWDSMHLFRQNSTQWRTGAMGPVGLDYNVIHHELTRKGITGDAFDDFMDNMRIIESAALKVIHKAK